MSDFWLRGSDLTANVECEKEEHYEKSYTGMNVFRNGMNLFRNGMHMFRTGMKTFRIGTGIWGNQNYKPLQIAAAIRLKQFIIASYTSDQQLRLHSE